MIQGDSDCSPAAVVFSEQEPPEILQRKKEEENKAQSHRSPERPDLESTGAPAPPGLITGSISAQHDPAAG